MYTLVVTLLEVLIKIGCYFFLAVHVAEMFVVQRNPLEFAELF